MLIGLVCFLLCTLCHCTITAAHSLKEAARSWSSSSSRNCRNWGNPSTKGSKKYCENSSQLSPLPVDCLKWHWLVPKKTGWAPQNLGVTPFQNRQPYPGPLLPIWILQLLMAVGEQVPPSPLGWYSNIMLSLSYKTDFSIQLSVFVDKFFCCTLNIWHSIWPSTIMASMTIKRGKHPC